jgi:hypothetical protein
VSKQHLFDKPRNVKRFFAVFYGLLGIFVLAEPFVHKHTFFRWEEYPVFYAAFGFAAFSLLILAAKYLLRPLVKRKEDYYD